MTHSVIPNSFDNLLQCGFFFFNFFVENLNNITKDGFISKSPVDILPSLSSLQHLTPLTSLFFLILILANGSYSKPVE